MIDCMIIGDSIAVGVSMVRKECVSYSKGGWNSWQWNKDYLSKATTKEYESIIISLGANDHKGVKTEKELRKMRESIKGKRVFWISPGKERKPVPQDAIERIAKEYGDTILSRPEKNMSSDGVHPTMTGYKVLAEQTK
jgi:lysophospholipase L1-like esterase